MRKRFINACLALMIAGMWSCGGGNKATENDEKQDTAQTTANNAGNKEATGIATKVKDYQTVKLTTDLSQLSDKEKQMLPLMIEAAKIMDELFWLQAYGDKNALLSKTQDDATKRYIEINYGPWDRLDGNKPFVEGVGEKPKGAQFYPADMTKEEYEKLDNKDKGSLYTIIRRKEDKSLEVVPYSDMYNERLTKAAELLKKAAELAENESLKKYLNLRAEAFLNNQYKASDMAWMDLKDNGLDLIIGPIENYEDALNGAKAAFEAYVLVKDKAWSEKLARYAKLLPDLQKGIPVEDKYKKETPGSNSQLAAFDVIYYAGDCNAGSKTIAVNLPNDEGIQLEKGTRRSQLKNTMKAKFDNILLPISKTLIAEDQRANVTFDAFFQNVMFHEVAHGLGIKNTITGKGLVRKALGNTASAIEEGKADILGLYMVTKLREMKELTEGNLNDNYVSFLASIFRSVRFGATSSHGKANMVCFNFFQKMGAFTRSENGSYKVDFEKFPEAVKGLTNKLLTLQGEGDYDATKKFLDEMAKVSEQLQKDLDRLQSAGIPKDIVFEQGLEALGLTAQ
ncbi:MAG TPA: Zn-dependent hydrolase [Microscillaceae bacterium]|nr:Zn-dependent hydrolase [Microscillaceae bacterium]